jgi:cysteinyl-tRNA synthetase
MALRLYNTLARTKEDFVPLDPGHVRLYVCGPTVYDLAHIGNARPVIVFDVLFRLLRRIYGEEHVSYVRNITDVDDKIIARASEDGISIRTLTESTAERYREDVAALGCLEPTHEPRATEYVARMIAMIERLMATGHAYAAEGHALFDVSSKPDYGKLARRSLDEMIAGARVEVAPYKRNPMDFVLWKPSSPDQPGWESPWGRGRPGWHIECSAMSEALLGETFDIHGGGIDLVFPHHENEIAQSECVHRGRALARVWMHNGFLQVEGEKMSKSLGNFVTIKDHLPPSLAFGGRSWDGPTLRFAMLRTHYRQPIDWTVRGLEESERTLRHWQSLMSLQFISWISEEPPPENVLDALGDDLNTPLAIAEMHRLAEAARGGDHESAQGLHQAGLQLGIDWGQVLLSSSEADARQLAGFSGDAQAEIERLIGLRNAARKAKDFKESDRIRDELLEKGIVLKDSPTGTSWEVKR